MSVQSKEMFVLRCKHTRQYLKKKSVGSLTMDIFQARHYPNEKSAKAGITSHMRYKHVMVTSDLEIVPIKMTITV